MSRGNKLLGVGNGWYFKSFRRDLLHAKSRESRAVVRHSEPKLSSLAVRAHVWRVKCKTSWAAEAASTPAPSFGGLLPIPFLHWLVPTNLAKLAHSHSISRDNMMLKSALFKSDYLV
jgi:hypothetical protein